MNLTDEQFDRVRALSLSLTGIQLAERHRELFATRCRRLKLGDWASLNDLLTAAEASDETARQRLIGLVTTSHTGFFRHPAHFDIAARHALSAVKERGVARLWSAAAATGEEPYSLAIAVIEAARRDDPPISILATDINPRVIETARTGEYGEAALQPLDSGRRGRFFGQAAGPGRWRISESIRGLVQFQQLGLNSDVWPVEAPFDVVLCRNLLMYLEARRRHLVLQRMASLVAPGGVLILDPAEHLGTGARLFAPGNNGVYFRRAAEPNGRPSARIRQFGDERRIS